MVDIGKGEILALCHTEHLLSVGGCQKFAFVIEQLQRIPMPRIVAGRDNDAAGCVTHAHRQFGCGRGSQTDVHHVEAHAHERSADHILHHFARNARISAHHNGVAALILFFNKRGISCRKLDDVKRIERVAGFTSDGAANARD